MAADFSDFRGLKFRYHHCRWCRRSDDRSFYRSTLRRNHAHRGSHAVIRRPDSSSELRSEIFSVCLSLPFHWGIFFLSYMVSFPVFSWEAGFLPLRKLPMSSPFSAGGSTSPAGFPSLSLPLPPENLQDASFFTFSDGNKPSYYMHKTQKSQKKSCLFSNILIYPKNLSGKE